MIFNYIIWSPSEVLLQLGPLKIRWYSLMIITAFLSARKLLTYFFQKEGRPVEDVEKFTICVLIASLVGARLGEVLFYNPMYYLHHPLEAILPIKLSPHFEVVGYKGLSYHGALIGGMLGTFLYANYHLVFSLFPFRFKVVRQKKAGQSALWLLTPLALGLQFGFLVRIGNFINSEIIGTPTHSQYGVIFTKPVIEEIGYSSSAIKAVRILESTPVTAEPVQGYVPVVIACTFSGTGLDEDHLRKFIENRLKSYLHSNPNITEHLYLPSDVELEYTITKNRKSQYIASIQAFGIPRHPVQLYESFSYVVTLILTFLWWKRKGATLRDGVVAGVAAAVCYGFRFFFEFFKDPFNILIDGKYPITMGHLLSLLTVLLGVLIVLFAHLQPNKKN